jgi:bla regulator protein blaR1
MVYHLLFEKEKMHRFNRFYLLFSLLLAFIVPLISLSVQSTALPVLAVEQLETFINVKSTETPFTKIVQTNVQTNYLPSILIGTYLLISLLLLIRFARNLLLIFIKIRKNRQVQWQNARLVLTNDQLIPHSFLRYIFIDQSVYENNQIEKEILRHELTHVQQKHSLDILWMELLQIIFWFNPFLWLYKKAIKLNHEFLADASVVASYANAGHYQQLLLMKVTQASSQMLTSPFNYLLTKKRLIMITKTSSQTMMAVKKCMLFPVLVFSLFVFSEKAFAQTNRDTSTTKKENEKQSLIVEKDFPYGEGASQELLNEYDSTLQNMMTDGKTRSGRKIQSIDMRKCNPVRMTYIYELMNKEQRDKRTALSGVIWKSLTTTPAKRIPSEEDMFAWTKEKKYGIWLDGKRIKNSELKKYQTNDFALFYVSKLEKNAFNYGDHYFQVNLYTTAYYETNLVKKKK